MNEVVDRRVERTRGALRRAFTKLFFADGYEAVTVGGVAAEANVGRSTFYEHFNSKDDLLWASMAHLFTVFADCVSDDAPPEELRKVLAHLWENRRRADAIFVGQPRLILSRSLAKLIEGRLAEMATKARPLTPLKLAALQLSDAQLAMTDHWLRGRAACAVERMASALHASTRASARALVFGLT